MLLLAACSPAEPDTQPTEHVAEAKSEVFTNGGFETGTAGMPPPSWTLQTFLNPTTGVTVQTPQTLAGLNLGAGGTGLTTEVNGVNQPDPDLGLTASLRWPRYGNQAAQVNFHSSSNFGHARNVNELSQTMTIGAGDVDPSDNQVHVRFVAAPVLENPGHALALQPYYFIQLTNLTQNTILYRDFNLSAQPGVPWKTVNGGTAQEVDYTDWALVDIAPGPTKLAMGDMVKLDVIASGCAPGGHFGEVYVDGVGSTVPGLFVSGTGPAQANAGSNITYTLTYKNGSGSAETGVVIDFTTPPNTTFQGITPPVGATCVTPAVGMAGTIVCTFVNPVAAGAFASFNVTVGVNAAATGQIVCGTYDIKSAQENALIGNKVVTTLGCTQDSDCSGGNWCKEAAPSACTPKLPNGAAIPTDAPHTGPTLDGTCTVAAALLVCASNVCDTADNKCGYANGDGPCMLANEGVVCRSGVCSPNGGVCIPFNGCAVDADCAAGNWCNTQTFACTPKLANGTVIPTVTGHTPPLAGACTAGAGAAVCIAGVCDTKDNDCGYANGDGPCTVATGGTVCRSATCSPNGGVCIPFGGCAVDADCAAGNWCNTQLFACTPKLANGTGIPTVTGHTPPLTGACTAGAGSAVCLSAVCDGNDNLCGYANGDGPCSMADAMTVCRSGACSSNATCEPAGGCNVDADCSAGNWCNISAHLCAPQVGNGGVMPTDGGHLTPIINGACNAGAATVVCVSGVCDTDDRCGFANGDGTCTAATGSVICRAGVCDPDGKCGLANADGPCTQGNAPVVCRSGACSVNGLVCVPVGGCYVDADCGASEWCNSQTYSCTPKLPNGTGIPTVAGHTPALTGACTAGAGTSVCSSAVCDAADNLCGYADGDGPCNAATGAVVCRSGSCSTAGVCKPATACTADPDCDAVTEYCDTGAHLCAPKLPNGKAMPTVTGHTPALDGICSLIEAPVVCISGVCDAKDNDCGYANGDGPCNGTTAGTVCRSSTCSPGGSVCIPSGGCAVDLDCAATEWCNTQTFTCTPKLDNGIKVPTVTGHAPALTGTCTVGAGAAVCASGVCDTADDKCGYANGDGPCSMTNAVTVCRAGACTAGGVCTNPTACATDTDCVTATQYCNTPVGLCAPKVPNGTPLPAVAGHMPSLDGTCSDTSAPIVCLSGVCDTADNKCGHAIGKGPCDAGDGAVVCRSLVCAVMGANAGTCVECVADTQCQGSQPVCDLGKDACVQCTSGEDAACVGATPVCVLGPETCAPCDGDLGDGTPAACAKSAEPYCFLTGATEGQCGKCTADADCAGHKGGPLCDTATGACAMGCTTDAQCGASAWCDAPAGGSGMCQPKLDNGTPLPSMPASVVKCSPAVGLRVCKSGACDAADDKCGLINGDGPCTSGAVCRSGACDGQDQKCGFLLLDGPCLNDAACRTGTCDKTTQTCGGGGCKTDDDCPTGDFCRSDGACTPKLPTGAACTAGNQCQSDACDAHKCDGIIPSGTGLLCAAQPAGGSDDGAGVVLLGLMLATAGLGLRRRR
jgi:hypothetical protein